MALREFDFIQGVQTSAAPDPGTPSQDNHMVSKGYADDTYAQFTSWGTKKADVTAIKAIASADRADGQIVLNMASNSFYRFDSGSSATGDDDLVLTPDAGSGRWIKATGSASGGNSATIVQEFDSSVASGITAGETLAANDAVCMEIHNGTGSDVYRVFKCDNDLATRRSFVGFSKASASVTPNIKTYTISAAYVSGNVIPIVINGRSYSVTYATTSDATLQALATAIATDQDVTSASVTVEGGNQTGTDDRVITITAKGGLSLNITGTTVTSGASQPTVTITQTQAASGGAVDIHQFGPLGSFTSLTPGANYYLSGTAGAITTTPSDPYIYVGRAMSSTFLFVDPSASFTSRWGSTDIFVRFHGSSTTGNAGAVADSELWNWSAWSAGTSSGATATWRIGGTQSSYQGETLLVDGGNTSGTAVNQFYGYNKTSWASKTGIGAAKGNRCFREFNGLFYANKGSSDFNGSGGSNVAKTWNNSAWATPTAWAQTRHGSGMFSTNSLLNCLGGADTGDSASTTHETRNTADSVSTETAIPQSAVPHSGANQTSSVGVIAALETSTSTKAYTWNGSAWSSLLTASYTTTGLGTGPVSGFSSARSLYVQNGGYNGSAVLATSMYYNGTAFSASTSSSNARSAAAGGCV